MVTSSNSKRSSCSSRMTCTEPAACDAFEPRTCTSCSVSAAACSDTVWISTEASSALAGWDGGGCGSADADGACGSEESGGVDGEGEAPGGSSDGCDSAEGEGSDGSDGCDSAEGEGS